MTTGVEVVSYSPLIVEKGRCQMFRCTDWLPTVKNPEEVDQERVKLDANLDTWVDHFNKVSLRWEIRRNIRGQVALFREGRDATVFRKLRG